MSGKKILNLLPFGFKIVGGVTLVSGLIASYYFIYLSLKPEWLQFHVFTVYSKYLETKTFTFITNNQGDEVAIMCYLFGFMLFLFSRDRKLSEKDFEYKIMASVYSLLLVVFLIMGSYLLVHGMAILSMLLLIVFFIPVIYIFTYYILKIIGQRRTGS